MKYTATIHYSIKGPANVASNAAQALAFRANMMETQIYRTQQRVLHIEFISKKPVESLRALHQALPELLEPGATDPQIQFMGCVITP